MERQIMGHPHKGILLNHEKDQSASMCSNVDELRWHYAKWEKPETKASQYMAPCPWHTQNKQTHMGRKQSGGCQGLGAGG